MPRGYLTVKRNIGPFTIFGKMILLKKRIATNHIFEIPICYNNEERIELPLCEIKVGPKNKKSNDKVRSLFSKYANVKYVDIIPSDIPLRL
jgi:hypothetical protein